MFCLSLLYSSCLLLSVHSVILCSVLLFICSSYRYLLIPHFFPVLSVLLFFVPSVPPSPSLFSFSFLFLSPLLSFFFLFFFSYYCPPLALLSFPTRLPSVLSRGTLSPSPLSLFPSFPVAFALLLSLISPFPYFLFSSRLPFLPPHFSSLFNSVLLSSSHLPSHALTPSRFRPLPLFPSCCLP